jgi:hypothetical protein
MSQPRVLLDSVGCLPGLIIDTKNGGSKFSRDIDKFYQTTRRHIEKVVRILGKWVVRMGGGWNWLRIVSISGLSY